MKHLLPAVLLACALPLASCSSAKAEYEDLSGNAYALGGVDDVELRDAIVRFDDSGLAVYQVRLINEDDDTRWIEWRSRWFDDQGFEVKDQADAWRRIKLFPNGEEPLRSLAPSPAATRCEVQIRKAKDGI